MFLFYIVISLFVSIIGWWLKRMIEARLSPLSKFPGNTLYDPIFGNMPVTKFWVNFHQRWRYMYKKYGSIYRIYVLNGEPWICVADPATVRHVLSVNSRNYIRGSAPTVDVLRSVIGKTSLLLSNGEAHKKHRSVISPAFRLGTLKKLFPHMVGCTNKLLDHWREIMTKSGANDLSGDLKNFVSQLTLNVIGLAAFGFDFQCIGHQSDIADNMQSIINSQDLLTHAIKQHLAIRIPFVSKFFLKASEKFDAGVEITRKLLKHMVNEKLKLIDDWKHLESSFLEMVIGSSVGNKEIQLSDEEVNDELMTFILAGHETSSLTLTYTMYFLCKFPEWQSKCRQELMSLDGENLNWESVHDLKYLKAVVCESLRLLPPAPIVLRQTIEEDYFKGIRVPPKTNISVLIGLMHRLPEYWPDPEEFKPERFLNVDQTNSDAYMPFGDGVHKCIGYQFAMAEIYVALSLMLKSYQFELISPKEDLQFVLGITMAPSTPIIVKITPA